MSGPERRKSARVDVALPVSVQGFLVGGGTWDEVTQTDDISAGGISFVLKRPVELGHVLYLNLPLPQRLRQFDLSDTSCRVYGLVRSISRRTGVYRVGVMFFGKFP